jgi:hypothetical protein
VMRFESLRFGCYLEESAAGLFERESEG